MILVIDNYDSFTYNLVQYLGELGADVQVRRNNEISLDQIEALALHHERSKQRGESGRGGTPLHHLAHRAGGLVHREVLMAHELLEQRAEHHATFNMTGGAADT